MIFSKLLIRKNFHKKTNDLFKSINDFFRIEIKVISSLFEIEIKVIVF